jgi:hypothetical protein
VSRRCSWGIRYNFLIVVQTFGAALWIVDYVLQGALNGVDRLYFHQGTISNCVSESRFIKHLLNDTRHTVSGASLPFSLHTMARHLFPSFLEPMVLN